MTSPANATTTDTGRTYEWPPTGETFASVTTIAKGGTPMGYPLLRWHQRKPTEYAVRKRALWLPIAEDEDQGEEAAIDLIVNAATRHRDAAAVRGTDVHEWAEKVGKGAAVSEAPEHLRLYVEQFARFLSDWHPTFVETEATVYCRSATIPYAGTMDWSAHIPGHGFVIGDIKTKPDGKYIYGEVGLQLAAYRFADFIGRVDGTEDKVPHYDACLALVVRPSSYDLIPVRAEEGELRAFKAAAHVRQFCEVDSRTVLGRKLRPPVEVVAL